MNMVLEFIPAYVWAIILIAGVLGLFMRNRISNIIGGIGRPLGLKVQTTLIILSVVAIMAGGFGVIQDWASGIGIGVAEITDEAPEVVGTVTGAVTVTLSDGLSNATTTEDYLNDDEDFMTIYSADASIADGEEYAFNATIQRQFISEDANILVTCTVPDKELAGVTADNIAEKTGGQIDLDYVGTTSTGTHSTDNTVWTYLALAEGTGSGNIQIKFDAEETYHDGMADLDDYVDVTCDADGTPFTLRILANS